MAASTVASSSQVWMRTSTTNGWSAKAAFVVGSNIYVVVQETAAAGKIRVYKSAISTTLSFTEQDSANAQAFSGTAQPFSASLDASNNITILYFTSGTSLGHRVFNTSTNLWGAAATAPSTLAWAGDSIRTASRSDGDRLNVYNQANDSADIIITRWEGASWTAATVLAITDGGASGILDAFIDSSDNFNYFYLHASNDDTVWGGFNSSNTTATPVNIDATSIASDVNRLTAGNYEPYNDSGTTRVEIAYLESDSTLSTATVTLSGTPASGSIGTPQAVEATATNVGANTVVTTAAYNGNLYAIWWDDANNGTFYYVTKAIGASSWGSRQTWKTQSGGDITSTTNMVVHAISVPSVGLAVLYQDGTDVKIDWLVISATAVERTLTSNKVGIQALNERTLTSNKVGIQKVNERSLTSNKVGLASLKERTISSVLGIAKSFERSLTSNKVGIQKYNERTVTTVTGIQKYNERSLTSNKVGIQTLNERTVSSSLSVRTLKERTLTSSISIQTLAERGILNPVIGVRTLNERSITSILGVQRLLERSVSSNIGIRVLSDRTVTSVLGVQRIVEKTVSSVVGISTFNQRTISSALGIAKLFERSVSSSIGIQSQLERTISSYIGIAESATVERTVTSILGVRTLNERTITSALSVVEVTTHTNTVSSTLAVQTVNERAVNSIVGVRTQNERVVSSVVHIATISERSIASLLGVARGNERTILSSLAVQAYNARTVQSSLAIQTRSEHTITSFIGIAQLFERTITSSLGILSGGIRTVQSTLGVQTYEDRTVLSVIGVRLSQTGGIPFVVPSGNTVFVAERRINETAVTRSAHFVVSEREPKFFVTPSGALIVKKD